MRTHELKTQPDDFGAVLAGTMTHQARKNDRDFAVGDLLVLKEWRPTRGACDWQNSGQSGRRGAYEPELSGIYTGRRAVVRVTHLTCGQYGLPADLAIMSIKLESAKLVRDSL